MILNVKEGINTKIGRYITSQHPFINNYMLLKYTHIAATCVCVCVMTSMSFDTTQENKKN